MNTNTITKQSGAALITALFIVALVASMAVIMQLYQSVNIRRTQLLINNDQMMLDSTGAKLWAMKKLRTNLINNDPAKGPIDFFPITFTDTTSHDATIEAHISDEQGKFNINNLVEQKYFYDFAKLLRAVDPDLDQQTIQDINQATHDWLVRKRGMVLSGNNKQKNLTSYYLEQQPPYRASHHKMSSPSELRLVAGISQSLYNKLAPHITALPDITTININTASAPVVMTLGDIDIKQAQSIVARTNNSPYMSKQAVLNTAELKDSNIQTQQITLVSDFFLITTIINKDQQNLISYCLLKRPRDIRDKKAPLNYELWSSELAY